MQVDCSYTDMLRGPVGLGFAAIFLTDAIADGRMLPLEVGPIL